MSKYSLEEIRVELYRRVRAIPPVDAAHDFSHIERVILLTCNLYQAEMKARFKKNLTETEMFIPECAALLHDCVPVTKDSPLRNQSSRLSAEKAKEWLTELGWEEHAELGSIQEVCEAVEDHSYSAGLVTGRGPRSLLGECLQDADRLEALGAIGLYRVIATGVSFGSKLFHPDDPFGDEREYDDKKYMVDHFFVKLLKLPQSFRTSSGRAEANSRADFLRSFLAQLKKEITS